MYRSRKFKAGCLNVVTQPEHSPQLYIKLFSVAASIKKSSKISENEYCRVRSVTPPLEINKAQPLLGKIGKHLFIDPEDNWHNELTDAYAAPEEVKDLIPDHFIPAMNWFSFVFFPVQHRLVYSMENEEKKFFGIHKAAKALQQVLQEAAIAIDMPDLEVRVHAETSNEGRDKILNMTQINRLEIEVELPNPDDLRSTQAKYKARLKKLKVRKKHMVLSAEKHASIEPDGELKTEIHVASSNGYVRAKGKSSDGEVLDLSTKDHPLIATLEFIPKKTQQSFILAEEGQRIIDPIVDRLSEISET